MIRALTVLVIACSSPPIARVAPRDDTGALAARTVHRPPPVGLAYVHARVLDVEGRRWLVDHSVIVRGDRIIAVGPSSSTAIPHGAERVDLAGRALLPGLIDMHAHVHRDGGVLAIASGVTTVRDLGNDPDVLDALVARFDAGTAVGPHVERWGRIEGRGPKAIAAPVTATTPAEATAAVEGYVRRGYRGIKIYGAVTPTLVPVIVKLAHDRGLPVTGHVPAFMRADDAIAAGVDGIEHINMLMLAVLATRETDTRDHARFTIVGERGGTVDLASPRVRELVALLRDRRIVVDPTLVVLERMFTAVPGEIAPGQRRQIERMPAALQRRHAAARVVVSADRRADYQAAWDRMLALVHLLHVEGVTLVIGSDSTAGLMLHRELELFAEAGLGAGDILEIATLGNARALRLDREIGSIVPGKRADLVVIDGDPLAEISAIRHVVATMRAGVVYPSAPLYASLGFAP